MVALDGPHYLSLFPARSEERAGALLGLLRDDFPVAVRGLVEGGSPAGTDPAREDACFRKMVRVRRPGGPRAIEGLVRRDMDAAPRETKQPVTVFAVRDLVAREAFDRYADRLDIVLVDLGSHHFHVEAPEAMARLPAAVVG
ncbi:hypothetical protein OG349_03835 [Streptomyces sp. NBC_01317]|uniref:hypothetical protein n=1 Tax=Streptomyces sp. NBC_01317 TaxID=2903822 RepID=UPI002E131265|nr:hypothetical protein OG349_03835 [Streptomyces sp. NBC_01317]